MQNGRTTADLIYYTKNSSVETNRSKKTAKKAAAAKQAAYMLMQKRGEPWPFYGA